MPYYFDGYSDKSLSLHYYVVTNVRYACKIIKHHYQTLSLSIRIYNSIGHHLYNSL